MQLIFQLFSIRNRIGIRFPVIQNVDHIVDDDVVLDDHRLRLAAGDEALQTAAPVPTVESLVSAADAALYRAKSAGSNRVA
jgi:GGDEF domain-containing protein